MSHDLADTGTEGGCLTEPRGLERIAELGELGGNGADYSGAHFSWHFQTTLENFLMDDLRGTESCVMVQMCLFIALQLYHS